MTFLFLQQFTGFKTFPPKKQPKDQKVHISAKPPHYSKCVVLMTQNDLLCLTILDLHQKLITFSLARSLNISLPDTIEICHVFKDNLLIHKQTNKETIRRRLEWI